MATGHKLSIWEQASF